MKKYLGLGINDLRIIKFPGSKMKDPYILSIVHLYIRNSGFSKIISSIKLIGPPTLFLLKISRIVGTFTFKFYKEFDFLIFICYYNSDSCLNNYFINTPEVPDLIVISKNFDFRPKAQTGMKIIINSYRISHRKHRLTDTSVCGVSAPLKFSLAFN